MSCLVEDEHIYQKNLSVLTLNSTSHGRNLGTNNQIKNESQNLLLEFLIFRKP